MSKAILMSIQPKWVAKILNGEKTIEVRKKFPKNYVGWVYIYCTKDNKRDLYFDEQFDEAYFKNPKDDQTAYEFCLKMKPLNGKVVARFWCDKVEETFFQQEESFSNEIEKTLKDSCLTYDELWNYVGNKTFYKIHISRLEIFDIPRELCEFHTNIKKEPPEELLCPECGKPMEYYEYKYLTKAPQSMMYIYIDK